MESIRSHFDADEVNYWAISILAVRWLIIAAVIRVSHAFEMFIRTTIDQQTVCRGLALPRSFASTAAISWSFRCEAYGVAWGFPRSIYAIACDCKS